LLIGGYAWIINQWEKILEKGISPEIDPDVINSTPEFWQQAEICPIQDLWTLRLDSGRKIWRNVMYLLVDRVW
jgi:hypothetical protein